MMKKKIKSFLMTKVLPPLIYLFLRLLRATMRVEYVNQSPLDTTLADNPGSIICFWHSRLLMMPFAKTWKPVKVLISLHRDGELIARTVEFFKNVGTVRGSYKKMSISSMRGIVGHLKAGVSIAITPDGPKGPRQKIKGGIIELARLSGKAIVPLAYSAGKKKLFIPGTGSFSPTLFQELSSFGAIPFMLTAQ